MVFLSEEQGRIEIEGFPPQEVPSKTDPARRFHEDGKVRVVFTDERQYFMGIFSVTDARKIHEEIGKALWIAEEFHV